MNEYPQSKFERLALLALLNGKLSPTDGRKWKLLKRHGWVDKQGNLTPKGQRYGETVEKNKSYQKYFSRVQ